LGEIFLRLDKFLSDLRILTQEGNISFKGVKIGRNLHLGGFNVLIGGLLGLLAIGFPQTRIFEVFFTILKEVRNLGDLFGRTFGRNTHILGVLSALSRQVCKGLFTDRDFHFAKICVAVSKLISR